MEVTYTKAPFVKRIISFAFDALVFFVLASLLAWAGYVCLPLMPNYKAASDTFSSLQLESSLYVESEGSNISIEKYLENSEATDEDADVYYEKALTSFYSNTLFFESSEAGLNSYMALKVGEDAILDSSGLAYWSVSSTGEVSPRGGLSKAELREFYVSVLNNHANSSLSNNADYVNSSKNITRYSLLMIIVVLNIAAILVWLVVPLIFHRGKRSFGKLIGKVGILNVHALSPKWWHYLLRFLFGLVVELNGSLLCFGIPLIVSFSMMAFSKRGQSLHDYVCNTYVVDASDQSIYETQGEYMAAQEKINQINVREPGPLIGK